MSGRHSISNLNQDVAQCAQWLGSMVRGRPLKSFSAKGIGHLRFDQQRQACRPERA
jgi:hypothetical protein